VGLAVALLTLKVPKAGVLSPQPRRTSITMADQTRICAIDVSEALCHFRIGDVINLMRPRLEQHRIHDARHMTADAMARLGFCKGDECDARGASGKTSGVFSVHKSDNQKRDSRKR
jgi:hypothetical protein